MKEQDDEERHIALTITEDTKFLVFCLTCYITLYMAEEDNIFTRVMGEASAFDHYMSYSKDHKIYEADVQTKTISEFDPLYGFVTISSDKPNGKGHIPPEESDELPL